MTNPVTGPTSPEGPRSTKGAQGPKAGKFEDEMRKIEEPGKVGEVEFEKRRRREFKKPIEEEGELESKETKGPSPFETEFYSEEVPEAPLGFSEMEEPVGFAGEEAALPTEPGTSVSKMMAPKTPEIEEHLPEAEEFWEDFDLPDQPPGPTRLKETASENRIAPEKKEAEAKKKMKPSLTASIEKPKQKPIAGKIEKKVKPLAPSPFEPTPSAEKKVKTSIKKIVPGMEEGELEESRMESKEEVVISRLPGKIQKKEEKISKEKLVGKEAAPEFEKEKQKKNTVTESIPVRPPDPLPPNCQQIAQAVQTSSSPFLNLQTATLFYQMVGTMVYMTNAKPGISLTEVTLSNPMFQNSVFFNSVITIEKYATAPDSFNVRLTGTPEAVQVFKSNMESLTAAFTAAYENRPRRVSFRIGRLETEIAPQRPLIRRKREGGGKEDLNQR